MPPHCNMASILGIFIFLGVTVHRSGRISVLYFIGKKACISWLSKAVHILSQLSLPSFYFLQLWRSEYECWNGLLISDNCVAFSVCCWHMLSVVGKSQTPFSRKAFFFFSVGVTVASAFVKRLAGSFSVLASVLVFTCNPGKGTGKQQAKIAPISSMLPPFLWNRHFCLQ